MTDTGPKFAPTPEIILPPSVATGSGLGVQVPVSIRHRSPVPVTLTITVVGLAPTWVPLPLTIGPVAAGVTSQVLLELLPERGALAAEYPFVVLVEAVPAGAAGGTPQLGMAESVLVLDTADRVTLTVDPLQPQATFGKKIRAHVTNPARTERVVSLRSVAAHGAAISLAADDIIIPPGRTVTVPGRIRVTRPRIFGHRNSHTFTVSARGLGAPEHVEGSLKSRPLIRSGVGNTLVMLLVIALWVTGGFWAVPRISDWLKREEQQSAVSTVEPGAGDGTNVVPTDAGDDGGDSAGDDAADSAGDDAGGPGADGDDPGDGDGAGTVGGARLAGTITGVQPEGVAVTIEPTTVVAAQETDAEPAQGLIGAQPATAGTDGGGPLGKIFGSQSRLATDDPADQKRTMLSNDKGGWSFAGIRTPGFLLVTFAAPGFRTQRFVVDSSLLTPDSAPMEIEMVPGDGTMSGAVSGPNGPVRGATVTLTDGETTVETSSVSTVAPTGDAGVPVGSWKVDGLSTPGTFLVTVSAPGYATASSLVHLDAGGSATSNISLSTGSAAVIGQVSGASDTGVIGGLGGVTLTATDGDAITRTATTVTSGPIGRYTLPDLPPGEYTLTASGDGYQDQVRQITITEGVGALTVDISMSRTNGVVNGTVTDESGNGLVGAGLTLSGEPGSYKTMTVSAPAGSFRFTGVPPGTYVLTAAQYGRRTTYATVEIGASGTRTVDLVLESAPEVELTADGSIRGRVVDARTNGALTCDRAPTPPAACEFRVSTRVQAADGGSRRLFDEYGAGGDFQLPKEGRSDVTGLLPGVYTITVTAPGYEVASTQVEVIQGQPTAIGQLALQPLAMLAGTVTTKVGATATPSCVILVPATAQDPTGCTRSAGDTGCTATGVTGAHCRLTAADGSYEIRGLVAGGYRLSVLPTDPEYLPTVPLELQLDLGESARSDAALDRLGRAEITVLKPNLTNVALSAADGIEVTLTRLSGTGVPTFTGRTNAQGLLQVVGLQGSYRVTAQNNGNTAQGLTGLVNINQTASLDVVLAEAQGPVTGRVVTTIDAAPRPVAGAEVKVTGVVGFNGRTPVMGTATVTTDANGCYAIVGHTHTGAVTGTGPCAGSAISGTAVGHPVTGVDALPPAEPSTLVALVVGYSVRETTTNNTFALEATNQLIVTGSGGALSINQIVLGAQPRPLGAHALVGIVPDLNGNPVREGNVTGAVITVTRRAAGSGAVGVTVADATSATPGRLVWQDSTITEQDRVVPGRYTLQAAKTGYQTATVDVFCDIGAECVLVRPGGPVTDIAEFTMSQLPRISGRLTVNGSSTPEGVSLDEAVFTTTTAPAGSGIVTLRSDENGRLIFRDSNLDGENAGLSRPGRYVFSVSLRGYSPQTLSVDCLATFDAVPGPTDLPDNFVNGCRPADVDLSRLPTVAGTVELDPLGPATSSSSIQVRLLQTPFPGMSVALSIDSDTGELIWTDANNTVLAQQAQRGGYTIEFSLNGYVTETRTFSCAVPLTTCGPSINPDGTDSGPVTLQSLPAPTATVAVAAANPVDENPAASAPAVEWSRATVTVLSRSAGASNLTITPVAALGTSTTLTFVDPDLPVAGTVRPGTYTFTVALPGYVTSPVYTLTCQVSTPCVPRLGTDPVTTITLTPHASFAGRGHLVADPVTTGADLSGAVFQVVNLTSGIGAVTITSDGSGNLSWAETGKPAGLVTPGEYRITVSRSGYVGETKDLNWRTCQQAGATGPCPSLNLKISKTSSLQIVVVGGSSATPVPGPLVSLSGTQLAKNTVAAAPTTNSVGFPDLSTADAVVNGYVVEVRAAGYASVIVSSVDGTPAGALTDPVQCTWTDGTGDHPHSEAGIHLFPGRTTVCTVTLQPLGTFSGRTQALIPDLPVVPGSLNGVRTNLSTVRLTLTQGADTLVGTSDSVGNFSITGTNQIEGIKPGTWQVKAELSGYETVTGTVTFDDNNTLTASSSPYITVAAGSATVHLTVVPVRLQVNLRSQGVPVTTSVEVNLSTASTPKSCFLPIDESTPATQPSHQDCVLPGTGSQAGDDPNAVFIGNLYPGIYTLRITPYTNRYQSVLTQLQVVAGTPTQAIALNLDTRSSTLHGTVRSDVAPYTPLPGATVWLAASSDTSQAAHNLSGAEMIATSSAGPTDPGTFTFTEIPDGFYRLVVSLDGYARYVGTELTMQSSLNPNPPPVTVQLGQSQRQVDIVVASAAVPGLNLSGTKVKLTRTDGDSATVLGPVDVASRSAGWTATFNNVPIGQYHASITALPQGHLFEVDADYGIDVEVNEPTPAEQNSPPPIVRDLLLNETQVTLAATWASNSCWNTSPTGPTTVTATLTSPGEDPYTAVNLTVSGQQATGKVFVKTGRPYSYTATPDGTFFSPASASFTPTSVASDAVNSQSLRLLPAQVPAQVTVTVDGSGLAGVAVTATSPGETTMTGTTGGADGRTTVCLTANTNWTLAVSRANTSLPEILLPTQTLTTTAEPSPSNAKTFTGRTIRGEVGFTPVEDRTTPVTAKLTLRRPDNPSFLQERTGIGIAASGVPAAARGWIVPDGNYTLSAEQTDGSAFAPTAATAVPANGQATLTLEYALVMFEIQVLHEGNPLSGATVQAKAPGAATFTTVGTTEDGVLRLPDRARGLWTFKASKSDATGTWESGEVTHDSAPAALPGPLTTIQEVPVTVTFTPIEVDDETGDDTADDTGGG